MPNKQTKSGRLATYPGPVTLQESRRSRYLELIGAVIPLAVGVHMLLTGATAPVERAGLFFVALAAGFTIALAIHDLRQPHSLTLSVNDFRISRGSEQLTVRWVDVQHFREVGDDGAFAVGFDLTRELDVDAPEYYFRLRQHYGLDGAELLSLLVRWHAKAVSAGESHG